MSEVRLQTEVRRLQKNTEGRVTSNSLSAQRAPVLSNTEGRVSLCFYLSHFHSFYIVSLGCSLQHLLISMPQGRQMPQGG